jgi:uncharacterized protein (TIGR03067 family)
MRRPFALCFSLLVPLVLFAADPEPENDSKTIQGTWKIVKATKGGEVPSEQMLKSEFTFTADKVSVTHSGGDVNPAQYKLDPKKKPREIDITPSTGADLVVRGIYKFEKGQLILHVGKPGGDRPKDFEEKVEATLVLERAKPKKE